MLLESIMHPQLPVTFQAAFLRFHQVIDERSLCGVINGVNALVDAGFALHLACQAELQSANPPQNHPPAGRDRTQAWAAMLCQQRTVVAEQIIELSNCLVKVTTRSREGPHQ